MALSRLGGLRLSSHLVRMLPALAATKDSLVPVRSFASAKSSAAVVSKSSGNADSSLVKLLKSEIEHEKKQKDAPKDVPKDSLKVPAPFTLQDKPGSQEVILRRSYGSEDIAVTCVFRLSPYDAPMEEEEDDEEADQPVSQEEVHMNVTIAKGGDSPVLEISCTCSEGEIVIEKVSYLESKSSKDDEMVYDGPEFEELDEDLQEQFRKYLEARGINDELCNFLVNFMPEKERQEYIRWMENVANFVRNHNGKQLIHIGTEAAGPSMSRDGTELGPSRNDQGNEQKKTGNVGNEQQKTGTYQNCTVFNLNLQSADDALKVLKSLQ